MPGSKKSLSAFLLRVVCPPRTRHSTSVISRPRKPSNVVRAKWVLCTLAIFFCPTIYANDLPEVAVRQVGNGNTPGSATSHKNCWIFTHLKKSGGQTVKKIVHTRWGSRYKEFDGRGWVMGEDVAAEFANTLASGNKWNMVVGGYPEALRRTEAVDHSCTFFTMFRHPVTRLVSAFYYCRSRPIDPLCGSGIVLSEDIDLVAFAKHWGNFAFFQFVTRFVIADDVNRFLLTPEGGHHPRSDWPRFPAWYRLKLYFEAQERDTGADHISDQALYNMLPPIQDLIRDGYAAVGILEEFNTTLSLFDVALEMPGVDWHKDFGQYGISNADEKYAKEKEDSLREAWNSSEIRRYMRIDLLLYEHAVSVFKDQVRLYKLD